MYYTHGIQVTSKDHKLSYSLHGSHDQVCLLCDYSNRTHTLHTHTSECHVQMAQPTHNFRPQSSYLLFKNSRTSRPKWFPTKSGPLPGTLQAALCVKHVSTQLNIFRYSVFPLNMMALLHSLLFNLYIC